MRLDKGSISAPFHINGGIILEKYTLEHIQKLIEKYNEKIYPIYAEQLSEKLKGKTNLTEIVTVMIGINSLYVENVIAATLYVLLNGYDVKEDCEKDS